MKTEELLRLIEKQLSDSPFSESGKLQKWVVISKAQDGDKKLLQCLLASKKLKKEFFKTVSTDDASDALVFNQQKFVRFLELKHFLKDSYTEYKNKIGLQVDGEYLKPRGDVVLAWPYKDCVLQGGQAREDDKRNEVFFNQTVARDEITQLLTPKVFTAPARYSASGKTSKVQLNRDAAINEKRGLPKDTITDNLIIKGNNLLALHSLKEQFSERVKLIYIDPPYNTGNDSFQYNDNFNHSTWLTFMKNRLEVARELLRDDGVIFVQCDDNEQAYLKVMMDEIFGRDNFVTNFLWEKSNANLSKFYKNNFEYIACFIKDKATYKNKFVGGISEGMDDSSLLNRTNTYRELVFPAATINFTSVQETHIKKFKVGDAELLTNVLVKNSLNEGEVILKGHFKWTQTRLDKELRQGTIILSKTEKLRLRYKRDNKGDILLPYKSITRREGVHLSNLDKHGLDHAKPESLLWFLVRMVTQPGDIVLDFCLGSGTTAATAHKMGRQYIGVEQLEYIQSMVVTRLQKVIASEQDGISKAVDWKGGGEFVYLELKPHNQRFADAIQAATASGDLLRIWKEMRKKAFLDYNLDVKKQEEELAEFKTLPVNEQKQLLHDMLDKNQMYVPRSSLHDADRNCSNAEKQITTDFYGLKK